MWRSPRVSSGVNDRGASAFVATDELGDGEDRGRSGPGRVARSGGNEGVVVNPGDGSRDRRSTTPECSSPPQAMGVADEMCALVAATLATGSRAAWRRARRLCPSPGRTTRRQLVVARSGAGSLHGPRWGRQVPAAAALVPAALAAAGHGEAEHQDEQDRGDDEQDAPHGPPPCPYLHLCAGEPGVPKLFPASAFGSKLLRSRALWRSRLALSSNAPAGQRDQPHTHR